MFMKRLSLLLDDVSLIRSALKNSDFDPVQYAILGETAGAHGLVCTYINIAGGISERDLRLLKDIRKTFLNVRIPVQEEAFRLMLSLSPDMVTFVDIRSGKSQINPIDPAIHLESIQQMLLDLQANNISVSARIEPEINVLKSINKISLDYVEIDVSPYTIAENVNDELVNLDKIKSTAMGATKLGLGVNCCGSIRYEHVSTLAQVSNLEDIVMGEQIIQRAMLVGIERAVNEALQLIRHSDFE
jgi:pyridoxine 5-phosphate synthase